MRRMQERIDAMFEHFFRSEPFFEDFHTPLLEDRSKGVIGYRRPLVSTSETDKDIITEIEMPGLDKKDIQVSVTDDSIEVKAESKSKVEHKDEKKGVYRAEKNYLGFYRKLSLPPNVNPGKADAEYKNGVLKITLPKLKIKEQKKKVLEVK